MTKKIGVLGSGMVGKALAKGLAGKGYEVRIASRDGTKLDDVAAGVGKGSFVDVAAWADTVILAVKGSVAIEAVAMVSVQIAGKVVIDTCNPIADAPPVDGIIQFFTGPNDSLMERLQKAQPAARFVKAWSCVGNALMIDPALEGGPPSMFVCGNDEAAKKDVSAILERCGWAIEDLGKAAGARAIEPLCQLWCAPGMLRNDWRHAYRVLR